MLILKNVQEWYLKIALEKKSTILPFLNAKKSNTEWSKETTIVIARRIGFPSKNTLWENYQIKKNKETKYSVA